MKKVIILLLITTVSLYSEPFFNYGDFDFSSKMDFYNVPGLSISIVSDKQIIWASGFGDSVDVDTLFQAASFSKPVTALAVFKLVEDGILNLDSDINDYLTGWKLEETIHTRNRKVTLRMLLSHTSGIHESGLRGFGRGEKIPTSIYDILPNVRYYPGLKRRYSWSGYTIIQKIIEDVTGISFSEYLKNNIFEPIGMTRSSFDQPLTDEEINISPGHDLFGKEIEGGWRTYPQLAAAGLWSTPTDISKYIIEIQKILTEEYEGILSRESVELMLSYQTGGWGLGPSLKFQDEDLIFRHSGKNAGYTNYFIARAYKGDAVVIMSSGDNAWKLIMEIIHSFVDYKAWGI